MGGKAGHQRLAVLVGFGQVALDIARGNTHHTAEDRHGGGKIGAVTLPGIQQEPGHEIHVDGMIVHVQGIAAAAAEPGLDRQRPLIGSCGDGSRLAGQIVDRTLQMIRQGGIGLGDLFVPAVFQSGTNFNQGTQAGIARLEEGSGYAVGIAGLQVASNEQL